MTPRSKHILIIEPEPAVRASMERALRGATYRVKAVSSHEEGLARIETDLPDLVLLDLALPQHNGFELCRYIHEHWSVPIIVFTASESIINTADALQFGAQDFLATPANPEELRARVRRAIERPAQDRSAETSTLRVGALAIDLQAQTVSRDGQLVPLSRTDWALLAFLVRHAGQILPHRVILQRVWGDAFTEELGYLRSYVNRLRGALEDDPKSPQYLQTEPRLGYRFVIPNKVQQPNPPAFHAATSHAPAAASLNVPTPLTSFVGREAEVSSAEGLLLRPEVRLLTLTGPGGVGKTRLAIQLGMQLAHAFAGGVSFVDLSHVRAAERLLPAIAQALHVTDHGDEALLQGIKAALRAQAHLLILDNFEQVLAGAPLISSLLRATPAVTVIATSRSPLRISGEHEFPVPPLRLPDRDAPLPLQALERLPVVALFIERAQAVRPDFQLSAENALAVVEICDGLDGLPLAVELAAARIKVLSPEAIAARLTDRLALLTGGPRDLPARQQTLRNLLDWSYELLDPAVRPLFARLAVFVGGGTLEAIESVCAVEGAAAELLDGLAALVDASLLQQSEDRSGDTRFTMLATIREYAWATLERSGERSDMERQHAHSYLGLAEAAALALQRGHHRHWLDRLERDHDNLRAALQWAVDQGQAEILARFVAALWQFWHVHSHRREAYRWMEAAMAQRATLPAPIRARATYGAGWLAYDRREYEQAERYFQESLAASRALHDPAGVSEVLRGLGELALSQGSFADAQALFDESLALSGEIGSQLGQAWSLHHLGRVMLEQKRYGPAAAVLRDSCALFEAIGDKAGGAWSLHNLGRAALEQGSYERADQWLSDSLTLFRELGDKAGQAWSLQNLGRSALEQALLDQAGRLLRESLALFRDVGDHQGTGWSLYGLGRLAIACEQRTEAIARLDESMACFRRVSDAVGIEQTLDKQRLLATAERQVGQRDIC